MGKRSFLTVTSFAAIALATQAQAAGFYLQEQSVRGAGRAFSGEAADQGVASLWWNPASIARSGREAYVGAHAVLIDSEVNDAGSTITYPGGLTAPVRGEQRAFKPILAGLAPNLAIAAPVADRLALGFSVSAPYNLATKYPNRAWARYDGWTSELRTIDLQGTAAMQVTDWLDLGVAAHAEYAKARLTGAYPNLSPLLPDATSQLKGDGWDWGWSVGAQMHFDRLTVGASYKSKIDHTLNGSVLVSGLLGPLAAANADVDGMATFSTPWMAILAARYALTDQLTLNAQVQRIGWSKFDAIRVGGLPTGPQILPQDYKNTTSGAVGLDYVLNPGLTLRAGVQYDPTPTPDVGRTARVPDGDRWLVGVGATASPTPRLKVDAAFSYLAFKDSQVNHAQTFYAGTPAATTVRSVGDVQGTGYILSLGVRSAF